MAFDTSVISTYFSTHALNFYQAFLIFLIGFIAIKIILFILNTWFDKVDFDRTIEIFISRVVKIFLWGILFIVIVDNLGFDVAGFVAGLGVMGIVIGFATKDIFSNIAAGLFIMFYKPFRICDEVNAGGVKGTVKKVYLSCCIFNSENEEWIMIPNTKIWGNTITNYSRSKNNKMKKK